MRLSLLAAAALLTTLPVGAEVRIGFAAPLSGSLAAVGAQMRQGVEQAVADINAAGGVGGDKLVLYIEDDAGLPAQAVAAANKLVTRGVKLVVGHLQSGTTVPAAKVYSDEGIITITPTATGPEVTEGAGDLVFRTCGRNDQQASVAAAYLTRRFKGKRLAVLDDQTTYGKGLADALRGAMATAGQPVAVNGTVAQGEKDFTAVVTRLKAEGVDAVYYGGNYPEGGLLVRQMREAGLPAELVSGDTFATDEFWSIAGGAAEGVAMTFSNDARALPEAQPVLAAFRAKKQDPGAYVLYAYAAVQVWAKAAEKAQSADGPKVAKALRSGTYPSVIGPLSFDSHGDRARNDYIMYRWSNAAYKPIL